MSSIRMPPVSRIIGTQFLFLLILAGTAFAFLGTVSAYSVLLGGAITIDPNAYFASKVFRHTGARAMEQVVRSAYLGEIIKLALVGVGFALAYIFVRPLQVAALMAGFLLVHICGTVALARLQHEKTGQSRQGQSR